MYRLARCRYILRYLCFVVIGQAEINAVASDTRTQPCLPPQTRRPVCLPPSLVKTPIAKLQEHCQQNYLTLPAYKELQVAGGFRWTVTIHDKQYCGEIKSNKQDAKHSVAEVALQQLCSSSECLFLA